MSYMLRFQLDENIPKLLKKWMVSRGHSAEYAEKGTKNGKLASLAIDKGFILLSRDRDFLNSVLFPPAQFSGIIVLIPHPPRAERLIKAMDLLLSKVTEFKGKLFIADEEEFEITD